MRYRECECMDFVLTGCIVYHTPAVDVLSSTSPASRCLKEGGCYTPPYQHQQTAQPINI